MTNGQEQTPSNNPPDLSTRGRIDQLCNRIESGLRLPVEMPVETPPADVAPHGFLANWRLPRRGYWIIVFCAALGGVAGFLSVLPQTPVYRASTTLEIFDTTQEADLRPQLAILNSTALQDRAIRKLASSVSIEKPRQALPKVTVSASPASRTIRIVCDSPSPVVAAAYANTLAWEFIDERLESRWQTAQHTSDWLARKLEEQRAKLGASQQELQSHSDDEDKMSVADDKLRQIQAELSVAKADRIARQSRYELTKQAPVDTLPEVLDDESLRASRQKLDDARRALADGLVTYLYSGSPEVKRLQGNVTSIENDMNAARGRILARIHNDLVVAQRREQMLTQTMSTQESLVSSDASNVFRYNILKQEVDAGQRSYESLLQVRQAGINATMRSGDFQVVEAAYPPSAPETTGLGRNVTTGIALGLFAGIGLVVLRKRTDHTITMPGETACYLGAPELAVSPSESPDKPARKLWMNGRGRQKLLFGAEGPAAESFRVATTSLLSTTSRSGPPRAIAVSSSGANEGKTTVACNLAVSYAEINWRVLLIDGDIRRPRLHDIFSVENETGLAGLLERYHPTVPGDMASAIRRTAIPNLLVMPRGKLRSTAVDLLQSPRLAEIIRLARAEFDVIVIDTPPLLQLPDAEAIARLTDGVVFAVRSGKTLRETVAAARARFQENRIPVLGSILNDWSPDKHASGAKLSSSYRHPYR